MRNACSAANGDVYDALLDRRLEDWAAAERAVCAQGGRRMPAQTIAEVRASRLLAAPIPKELGGAGADLSSTARAVRRVAQVAPGTALALAMPLGNAANTRLRDEAVSPSQRAQLALGRAFIVEHALAGRILAVANSEPGAGGELAATRTRAARRADGKIGLSGQKSFATLGPDADFFVCSARHPSGELDAFFVAREAPGVTLAEDWDALGMRVTASVGLTLEDAPAAATFLYPGAIAAANARHWSTVLMAAVFVGIGEGALASAREEAPKSSSWARASVAECALNLEAARAFLESIAAEDVLPCTDAYVERCRRGKSFAARTAFDVASRCMMIAGGRAYRPGHALARALLDAAAGPLLRPPLPQAMDAIATQLLGA
jgi:alkylation response protein AidB-like acyl-CoA dehydrogenase